MLKNIYTKKIFFFKERSDANTQQKAKLLYK